ncbi:PLP-dependent transferase [Daejeonella sp. JGW-45]|uniref:PLP-dependent transferase n=1 Tax=Daejeonella sp. JGW-45 TaxID=3034148 RepID=UPI0023EB1556|nr:PLP-dependent transferase [Daejeonella sp. JGW-45]
MKRRDVVKYLSIAPVAGAVAGSAAPLEAVAAIPAATAKRDLIKELGLRTFINAYGVYTTHTASLMSDEVLDAINGSSKKFVLYNDLQDKVGEKIAAMCHAEAAMVTSGCWSAIVLGTAGVLTGMDRKKVALLPDVSSFEKNEVIVQRSHMGSYDHTLTNTGIKRVVVETADELEKAISPKTAMTWFYNEAAPWGKIGHEEWLAIAKKHNIPTMVDIAADVPPVENLWKFNDMGYDLVCVSGGKAIRGPQSAGILMGRKHLIAAARLSAPPGGNNIGRGMKVNKEEILGMYAALERFINLDHGKEWKMWEDRAAIIANAVNKVRGAKAEIFVPPHANVTPTLRINWDQSLIKLTSRDMTANLRDGEPSIEAPKYVENALIISVWMMQPGEEKIVARRLTEELNKASV